jgi:hypothetical protein
LMGMAIVSLFVWLSMHAAKCNQHRWERSISLTRQDCRTSTAVSDGNTKFREWIASQHSR